MAMQNTADAQSDSELGGRDHGTNYHDASFRSLKRFSPGSFFRAGRSLPDGVPSPSEERARISSSAMGIRLSLF